MAFIVLVGFGCFVGFFGWFLFFFHLFVWLAFFNGTALSQKAFYYGKNGFPQIITI